MKISLANVLPAAAVAILLMLASGCALSGISPFAYPHFWDFTGSEPKQSDLVGTYVVLKISGSPPSFHSTGNVRVILNSDHTASLSEIPEYDGFGEKLLCPRFASGTWQLYGSGEWTVNFWPNKVGQAKTGVEECDVLNTPFWVLGHNAPYRLYLPIGDPDEDTGIEFRRQ